MPYWLVVLQTGIVVYLFLVYFLTLRHVPADEALDRRVARYLVALAMIAALAVPVNSSDVFSYIGFGRTLAVHEMNPYLHSYREIHDAYAEYAWFPGRMPYGPTFLPIAAAAGLLSEHSVIAAVFMIKAAWLLCYALTTDLMAKSSIGSRRILLFAGNPLVILELMCNAHNDALVVLCLAATAAFVLRRRFLAAYAFSTLAATTKLPLLVTLGPIAVLAVRSRAWRSPWHFAAPTAILGTAATLIYVLGALPALTNPEGAISTASLQVQALKLAASAGQETLVRGAFLLAYLAFYAWRLRKVGDEQRCLSEVTYVLVGLLFFSTQLQPWYVTWLLAVAPFAASRWPSVLAASMSLGVISLYGLRYADIAHIPELRLLRILLLYAPPVAAALLYLRKPVMN